MSEEVQDIFGYALQLAQEGKKHVDAKPLSGFGNAGVLEIVSHFNANAYRAVYTLNFGDAIYVLHCFQKKSLKGKATPKPDMDLIRSRMKSAELHFRGELN